MPAQLDHIDEIKSLFAELASGPQEYDFQPPAMVSHAEQYAAQPERLRHYAKQVVCGRIMIFLAFSRMNTQALLHTYLLGVEARNPFPILLAARSQLELLSVVADTKRTIQGHSGEHSENFLGRVRAVDEALIKATFGTRSSVLKDLMPKIELSRLRPVTKDDYGALTSTNVVTWLEKLSKSGAYPECMKDYARLCDYVHPNYGMNMLHVVASPINSTLLRFSLSSQEPFERAVTASASVMIRAARGTLALMDEIQPPFGMGTVSYVA